MNYTSRYSIKAALLGSVALCLVAGAGMTGQAHAQGAAAQSVALDIRSQDLGSALTTFADRARLRLLFPSNIVAGKSSPALSGSFTREEALSRLLAGSGLSYAFTGADTVTITDRVTAAHDAPVDANGSLVLDTITISGAGSQNSVYSPYETAAPTAFISGENIERFRGSSPADIFRGTPGVMSGEARNGAGSIDPNIRGMQGFGRVSTTVDGAENGTTIYQGYQGLSNRTFVDPDFIAGVDISKGSDVASRGISGSVAIRTLTADDIIKPGNSWGVRVQGMAGTNTSNPTAGNTGGYIFTNNYGSVSDPSSGFGYATPSEYGMHKPGLLTPTQGSASIIAAVKDDNYDILLGYAFRKQGNYHAGTKGPSAHPVSTGERPFCYSSGVCLPNSIYRDYIENGGLTPFRAGEEVLNTELETHSLIAKATLNLEHDQTLQLGYNGFRSEAGDLRANLLTSDMNQPVQQNNTAGTKVDTLTARYRWDPYENDLIDLRANLWLTNLELRNPRRGSSNRTPETIGLAPDHRTGSDAIMWGIDLANTSRLKFDEYGSLDLSYGLSYLAEDTSPTPYAFYLDSGFTPRDGERQEISAFGKASYTPVDWITLNAGLKYTYSETKDRAIPANINTLNPKPVRSSEGFSPSLGVTLKPLEGVEIYANYSSALRFPSLAEATSSFSLTANSDVRPERANNWEIGTNFVKDGLFSMDDRSMIKFQYFNWNVEDYIARAFRQLPDGSSGMQIFNIDRARFSGMEMSARYEINGFAAEFGANYYLGIDYCQNETGCESKSLYGDFATNFIPPKYSASLTMSQKLLDDALTIGGRISYMGPRAIDHGQVTAQGLSQFITKVEWDPYWLVDLYAEYNISEDWKARVRVENIFDQYYVDPLGLVQQPGPGRTFYAGLTGNFGGSQAILPRLSHSGSDTEIRDWSGIYAGIHAGLLSSAFSGITVDRDGTPSAVSLSESADLGISNFQYGGQIGYNHQFANRFMLGVEADWSRTLISGQQDTFAIEGDMAGTSALQARTHYGIDWMSSVRGRIGYAATDRMLAYLTGGVAFLKQNQTRDQYRSNMANAQFPYGNQTDIYSTEHLSGMRYGLTIGGGVEYALNDRWSIKSDYTYNRFSEKNWRFENARAGIGRDYTAQGNAILGSSSIVNGRDAANSIDIHSIKFGLNYSF